MILDDICEKRKQQLEREKQRLSLADVKAMCKECSHTPVSFAKALKQDRLSVICEVKKASPSKGLISPDFRPVETAVCYEKSGAAAVSCLTEEHYFQGSSEYLKAIREKIAIPILRKDFIIDEYSIYEARAIGADAVLLIAAILDKAQMQEYMALAHELGLQTLTEVHNEKEIEKVGDLPTDCLGINNRDLTNFEVSLETTARLAELTKCKVLVSESGIKTNEDMRTVSAYGADAVLIGETLMRSGNIADTLMLLRNGV